MYPDACVRYLPYDAPDAVARFLGRYQPMFGVLMETELWPHLIAGCRAHGVPLFLANARLSERSARGYRRAAGLIGLALASLDGVAAQSEDDAARLRALGARQVAVCGNLKFDITPPPQAAALAAQLRQWRGERPLWMAASTREGEEALLLDALPADSPAVLLLTRATRSALPKWPSCCARAASVSAPQRQHRPARRHPRLAGRQHGRNVCLLSGRRSGLYRRQPCCRWAGKT